jgi:hypothetical protein
VTMTPKNISDDIIPAELKKAINNVVSLFSSADHYGIDITWLMPNAALDKRKLVKARASNNLKALEAASRSILGTDAEAGNGAPDDG